MAKVRLGLIGCGGIVQRSHVKGLTANGAILEVTAVCDVNPECLEAAKSVYTDANCYTDYRDMLNDVDAVSIALPHDLHFECGMFFAENKKHILMEKPLCNTEAECLRLIETCEKNNLILMCEYPVRYSVGYNKLKEVIDSGKYGKPFHVSVWTEQFTDHRFTPWTASEARLGGGQLFSHGCHYTDLLLWFLGDPEYGTHVGTNLGTPWMLREGTSTISMKFKSGATAMHFGTWGAKGSKMNYETQVFMDSGVMLCYSKKTQDVRCYYNEDFLHIETTYQADDENTYEVLWNNKEFEDKNLKAVMIEFIDCVNTGREPRTSGRKALESLRVIWRMYNAEENQKVADLSDLVGYDNE